jgi:hypothetical protein
MLANFRAVSGILRMCTPVHLFEECKLIFEFLVDSPAYKDDLACRTGCDLMSSQ